MLATINGYIEIKMVAFQITLPFFVLTSTGFWWGYSSYQVEYMR